MKIRGINYTYYFLLYLYITLKDQLKKIHFSIQVSSASAQDLNANIWKETHLVCAHCMILPTLQAFASPQLPSHFTNETMSVLTVNIYITLTRLPKEELQCL